MTLCTSPSKAHKASSTCSCTACVGLKSFQRPRYFCGQLLTDEDLATEQRYQIEKNKLHNRYLHGLGVVCGLRVTCHPKCASKGNILIEKGYALDCCGNDIVLCNDAEVDFIGMIKECQPKPEEDECASAAAPKKDECKDLEKKYCLIVKYKEEESRPVTALKKDEEGSSTKRCEPSRIREGYSFEVKECKDCNKGDRGIWENLWEEIKEDTAWGQIEKCLSRFPEEPIGSEEKLDLKNIKKEYHGDYFDIYCKAKDSIKSILESNGDTLHCNIKSELAEMEFPSRETDNYAGKVIYIFRKLGSILFQMQLDCICLHLLNPCYECSEEDDLVLACITVREEKIISICNLSRRQVMTFPKLFYWLPVNEIISRLINYVCCELSLEPELNVVSPGAMVMPQSFAMASKMYSASVSTASASFINTITTPEVIGPGLIYKKNLSEAKNLLKNKNISVVKEIEYKPTPDMLSLRNLKSTPLALKPGSKVDLFVKDDKVMFVRLHEEVEKVDEETIGNLRREFDSLKTDFSIMKSSMKRDLGSAIKLKANVEEAYQPLTIDLVKGLTKAIEPEHLKDIGGVRGRELKKAGIKSVREVLEAVPADVSDATKEPIANATKYIDHAENLAMEVTRSVYSELKKAEVTKKEDLTKVNTKSLAKKLKLSEIIVKKVISDIHSAK